MAIAISVRSALRAVVLLLVLGFCAAAAADCKRALPQAFLDLMQQSQAEKFGIQFYVKGQIIPGVVTRIGDDGMVEARSQDHDRILIRLDRIDAVVR